MALILWVSDPIRDTPLSAQAASGTAVLIGVLLLDAPRSLSVCKRPPQTKGRTSRTWTGEDPGRLRSELSVAVAALEPDEPVDTVPVDDLSVGVSPRPHLQVIHDLAAV